MPWNVDASPTKPTHETQETLQVFRGFPEAIFRKMPSKRPCESFVEKANQSVSGIQIKKVDTRYHR